MTGDSPPFDTEEALQLLLSERRRAVLRYLLAKGQSVVPLSELATAVELQFDSGHLDRADLETYLHHVDLPKLEAAGVIHYDAGSNRVICPDMDPVKALVTVLEEEFD